MSNDFTDIGFALSTEGEFLQLAGSIVNSGDRIYAPNGSLVLWQCPSGAQVWVQLDAADRVVGMDPYFAGDASIDVRLERRIEYPDGTALDGSFYAWAIPRPGTGDQDYPLVFACPEFDLYRGLSLPATATVHIAAFARELTLYRDAEEASSSGAADRHFIPTGSFSPESGPIEPPEPWAVLGGYVRSAVEHENCSTGRRFFALEVESLAGDYNVLADPVLLDRLPKPGELLTGSFWLSGRLDESSLGSD